MVGKWFKIAKNYFMFEYPNNYKYCSILENYTFKKYYFKINILFDNPQYPQFYNFRQFWIFYVNQLKFFDKLSFNITEIYFLKYIKFDEY
jgi:hypothetical protein